MSDRLQLKTMCSGSCDQFKFWEIGDYILEIVQDRKIVAKED